uniref:lectin 11-like n=1 Tax=Erigeron canadensis TaxID=72917 RepID=UPI001CB8D06B|nr:lectin 11-like [Erigeron canadensis]
MSFSRIHIMITFLLIVSIPYAVSITFNLPNIGPQHLNREIQVNGSYISDGGLQLTPNEIGSDRTQKAGQAIYYRQLRLWDNCTGELASFSTNFTFVIDSNGATNYGDGLAFFLAEKNSVITKGGAMGLPIDPITINATNRFVAVEFDTYYNRWDPLPSNTSRVADHVGISISSLTSVRTQSWFSDITRGRECQAWITYDSVSKNLSVSFTGYRNNTIVRQDGLVYKVDLRNELPEWVIFGFSAATGASFQRNTIISWSFTSSI